MPFQDYFQKKKAAFINRNNKSNADTSILRSSNDTIETTAKNRNYVFPLTKLPDELIQEVFSHLPQPDRLQLCLIDKRFNKIATKLLYRRIYLNDSNVVKSDFMHLAINWTLLNLPSSLKEDESRNIANYKLEKLIETLQNNIHITQAIQWIRINWDLDSVLQRSILNILCNQGKSLQRLENVTDPTCNDIISNGCFSKSNVSSFDMAPPNSLPEMAVPENYIPNLTKYLSQRISSRLSHMTLFIDPLRLFNYLYPLDVKLQIVDLKLHWRREFYNNDYFVTMVRSGNPLTKLSEVFDKRTLKILTIISWNDTLLKRETEMLKDFKEFEHLEDLSLISIKQDVHILVDLFSSLTNLKRLKMDFLEDYIPEPTSPHIFLSILLACSKLQFIDLRYDGLIPQIINIQENKFQLNQQCNCTNCQKVFSDILKGKIFMFPEDYYIHDIHDIAAKDIFKMMKYLSLLPYSKACDSYPSVRTQPMNLTNFVAKMNMNLLKYRNSKSQLVPKIVNNPHEHSTLNSTSTAHMSEPEMIVIDDDDDDDINMDPPQDSDDTVTTISDDLELPHDSLTKRDIIMCYHALIHHFKSIYVTFLKSFPHLRFLMLNDIPTIVMEENDERIFEPVFYHYDYKSNLHGWSKESNKSLENESNNNNNNPDTIARIATVM
ncbi:YJL149W [Saccharomyces arboricola H-6]|uniref:YJL149W n=1 Tax=Saccharomyces arboricola (strain H-6 / AS 2.3317 / CBS 10644) TaxID=1160507 RepID=J8LMC2_SACAR|nr:YJL149W [Saccharomyces arboricola H-6]